MKAYYWAVGIGLGVATTTGSLKAMELRVGASVDYSERMLFYGTPTGNAFDNYDNIGGALMLDAKYLRLATGIAHQFGAQLHRVEGREESDTGYRIDYLNLTGLGKFPFDLGRNVVWWPALGLRAAYNLRYAYSGTGNRSIDSAPHDLLLMLGAGLDATFSSRLALTGAILGGWDLMPSGGDSASHRKAFDVELSLGILFKL